MLEDFWHAVTHKDPLILDGAMGTELTRIGRKIGTRDWVASTLGDAADVAAIHRAYAQAGAQVHIANTFATARHVLAQVALADQFEPINRDLVDICRQAVGPKAWIAGSLSSYVVGSDRALLPAGQELFDNIADQATILADAGCALFVLEMLFDVEVTRTFIGAAATAGLPLSIGLTCDRLPDGTIGLSGAFRDRPDERVPLDQAVPRIIEVIPNGCDAILTVMHAQLDVTSDALDVIRAHWSGPLGAYPNSGRLLPPDDWDHNAVCSTASFVQHANEWRAKGAVLVGGCCGVGPAHIAALSKDWN